VTEARNEYGVVGLGRMGGNLARQALEKGIRVVGFTRHGAPENMIEAGLTEVRSYEDLKAQLSPPRAVFVYIPAGPPVDEVLDDLAATLDAGDVLLVDGGNSYWGDSIRRHDRLKERGVHFVDLGTSGGFEGARNGPALWRAASAKPSSWSSLFSLSSLSRVATLTRVLPEPDTSPSLSTTA
jgi:6-phosphogluconate dehydrogenase